MPERRVFRWLNSAERQRHGELLKKLHQATASKRELDTGYLFELTPKQMSASELGEWISYESRCCPFFDFEMRVERQGASISLKLTGGPGVREFLKQTALAK